MNELTKLDVENFKNNSKRILNAALALEHTRDEITTVVTKSIKGEDYTTAKLHININGEHIATSVMNIIKHK